MSLTSMLYDLGRIANKTASLGNDAKNLANGKPEKVLKKAAKREMYRNINKIMRKL